MLVPVAAVVAVQRPEVHEDFGHLATAPDAPRVLRRKGMWRPTPGVAVFRRLALRKPRGENPGAFQEIHASKRSASAAPGH